MSIEELAAAADAAEEGGCRIRVVVQSQTFPGSSKRCRVAPGLSGEVIDRHHTGDYYVRHVLLDVADVRAYLARASVPHA